jgi:hypothetical protein
MGNKSVAFAGPWIGESIGHDGPAHLWDVEVGEGWIRIQSCWEGQAGREVMMAQPMANGSAFMIGKQTAALIDAQHFVIAGWDTNDTRGGVGPGIAELSAREAYRQFKDARSPVP